MKENNKNIGFIGAGNLGRHTMNGLKDSYKIYAFDPIEAKEVLKLGVTYISLDELCEISDVIFLTIKPNKTEEILSKIKNLIGTKLIISFIAGISLEKLNSQFESSKNIIRAMPTLGVSKGISPIAVCSNFKIDKNNEGLNILSKLGRCLEIEESKFDAFTSIFGAGPAYISYLANLLSEIAKSNGFDNPEPWIGDLLGGTFEMHKSDESPSFNDIKSMVASKGGVTEAALNKIESSGIEDILKFAIEEAINKSKKLGES